MILLAVRLFPINFMILIVTIFGSPTKVFAVRPAVDSVKNQKLYEAGIDLIFQNLIVLGGESLLTLKNGSTLKLSKLRQRIPSIEFVWKQNMLTNHSAAACSGGMQSHWLTADDRKREGRPVIFQSRFMDVADFAPEDWTLFFHETLGALGIVDDEYQVSGPLLLLSRTAKSSGLSITELSAEYPELQKVELRKHAPKYKIDSTETCYIFPEAGGRGSPVTLANTTAIGGGGNGYGLQFKADLLAGFKTWGQKNGFTQSQLELFRTKLVALGVEPLPRQISKTIIPVEMKFGLSKRTGAPSVFLNLEKLYELKKKSPKVKVLLDYEGPPSDPIRFSTHQEWSGALVLIYEHVSRRFLSKE